MSDESQQPVPDGFETWNASWTAQNMPWRTEPELSEGRQRFLALRRAIVPNVNQGIYPFKDITLDRADVEWLLATHESGGLRGPVNWHDPAQWTRAGLDLRGADVSGVDLHGLPLARLRGSLTEGEYLAASPDQRQAAAVRFTKAKLYSASLEGSALNSASMEGADLYEAHLEEADLYAAHLARSDLRNAYFDSASTLNRVVLADDGIGPLVRDAHWNGVNLSGIRWAQVRMLGEEAVARQRQATDVGPEDATTRQAEYERAVRANRQLAAVLRSQGLTEPADRFAYRAQLCQRHVLRQEGTGKWSAYVGSLFLWAISGYGYRLWRILAAYGVVLIVFAVLYWLIGVHSFAHEARIQALWDSFLVSLSAIHGRSLLEQLGAWSPAAWIAAIESVFGIVIEGVFVAMLIQRFFVR